MNKPIAKPNQNKSTPNFGMLTQNLILWLSAINNNSGKPLFSSTDISKIKTIVMNLQTLPGYKELFNPEFFKLLFDFFKIETFLSSPLNIFTKLIKFFEFKPLVI